MVSLGVRQRSLCCPLRKCRRKFVVWERKWEMPLERPLCASQSYRLQSCHQNTPLHCWDSDTILRRKSIRQQGSHCLQGLNFSKSAFRQRKLFFLFPFPFNLLPFHLKQCSEMFRNLIVFISTYSTNPITCHMVKKKPNMKMPLQMLKTFLRSLRGLHPD